MYERVKAQKEIVLQYGTYIVVYMISYMLSRAGLCHLAGCLLGVEALVIYLLQYQKTKNLVDLKGLFTLAWVGGQGIACLQLSKLQTDWQWMTWACFFLIYIGFGIGYGKNHYCMTEETEELEKDSVYAKRLLICICGLAMVSVACFVLEAVVVGFIPLFSDKPHAYSYFHVSGVHYFTISCILIPAITVLYWKMCEGWKKSVIVLLLVCNVIAIAIPVLCVSRFQLLFAVGFAVVTYVMVNKGIKLRTILILLCIMVPVYVLLTVARNHDVEYLNGIFEMKNSQMPIFVTQPYIYVANNFENFNCMVVQLTEHTHGLKMLFPVFALTGLKFIYPHLVSFPAYITKTELTTLTMFYDAYYDFGIWGVFFFALVIGLASRMLLKLMDKVKNPVMYLFYGQLAIYLGLAFFTTWFSNPTTWFWFALTTMMFIFVGFKKKENRK